MPKPNDDAYPDLTADMLRSVVDGMDDRAVFVFDGGDDGKGAQVFANACACGLSGGDADWLAQTRFHDAAQKTALTADQTPYALLVDGRGAGPVTVGWLDGMGAERVFTFRAQPYHGAQVVVVTGQDAGPVAGHLGSSGHMTDDLADVIHDLGNIFGIFQMASDGLARLTLPHDATGKLRDIQDAVARGHVCLRKLADPGDAAQLPVLDTDIGDVLRSTAALFGRVLPTAISLNLDVPDGPSMGQCDRSMLEAAVIEMLGYARKSISANAQAGNIITLRLLRDDAGWDVCVLADFSDHIAPDMSPDGDRAANAPSAFAMADRLGAGIGARFETRVTMGSAGHLSLLIPHVAVAQDATDAALPIDASLARYRIILAERDAAVQNMLAQALRDTGAMVEIAAGGRAVCDLLDAGLAYDVVIVNPVLADDMTAQDLAAKISGRARIIVVSGAGGGSRGDAPFGLHLSKPVNVAGLVNAIALVPPRH